MLGSKVIDTHYLQQTLAKLISVGMIVVSYLLSMNPSYSYYGHDQCALSEAQIGTIRAVLVERNSSCNMNMTLASIIG